jgi:hypothetical protein
MVNDAAALLEQIDHDDHGRLKLQQRPAAARVA